MSDKSKRRFAVRYRGAWVVVDSVTDKVIDNFISRDVARSAAIRLNKAALAGEDA